MHLYEDLNWELVAHNLLVFEAIGDDTHIVRSDLEMGLIANRLMVVFCSENKILS